MKLRKQSIIAQMGTTGDYSLLEKIDPDNTLIPKEPTNNSMNTGPNSMSNTGLTS
jgi:hypothetical protein